MMFISKVNRESVKKLIKREENKNYTYFTLFFLVFSFFVFFVIKPTIQLAFSLKAKLIDMRQQEKIYSENITRIINIQTQLMKISQDSPLIDSSLPKKIELKQVINRITDIASEEAVIINQLSINPIQIEQIDKLDSNIKSVDIIIKMRGNFSDLKNFLSKITKGKRLFEIGRLLIDRDNNKENLVSSESGQLKIELVLKSFYL